MGLGGGRKRVKIGHDPNNTSWSRSTDSYGHRMLLSQGWQPGGTLGAENTSYKAHLTQASKSHIRVALRDDNLGLGAKRGSGQEAGECVGLDAFQAMLGRLNGKSQDALNKEQKSRDDLKRRAYVEKKGLINFVYGGRLVGDDQEQLRSQEDSSNSPVPQPKQPESERSIEKKSKKNKIKLVESQPEDPTSQSDSPEEKASMSVTKKKVKKRKNITDSELEPDASIVAATPGMSSEKEAQNSGNAKAEKARRKAEKAERRERKRLKREAKAATKFEFKGAKVEPEIELAPSNVVQEVLTVHQVPDKSPTSNAGGRHTGVRSRYIAAKRRAVMDPQALKEILMVKV